MERIISSRGLWARKSLKPESKSTIPHFCSREKTSLRQISCSRILLNQEKKESLAAFSIPYEISSKKSAQETWIESRVGVKPLKEAPRKGEEIFVFPRTPENNLTEEEADNLYKSLFQKVDFVPENTKKSWLRMLLGGYSRFSVIKRSTFQTYEYTTWHSENKDFYELYKIAPNFMGWFNVTVLHLWMLEIRSRSEGFTGASHRKSLNEIFWKDVESRILALGISNPLLVSKELKQLGQVYYGLVLGLDEGLLLGDSQLADSVWRVLYQLQPTDPSIINTVVKYIYRELETLDKLETDDFIWKGYVQWGRPIPVSK